MGSRSRVDDKNLQSMEGFGAYEERNHKLAASTEDVSVPQNLTILVSTSNILMRTYYNIEHLSRKNFLL